MSSKDSLSSPVSAVNGRLSDRAVDHKDPSGEQAARLSEATGLANVFHQTVHPKPEDFVPETVSEASI
jgi:hypothetical protein